MMADFIDWKTMLDESITPRTAGSHVDHLSKMFVNSHMIAHHSDGNWSGWDAVVILFAPPNPALKPKIVLITDHFGSCSGCDVWDEVSDRTLKELLISIANNARTFDSFEEIDNFLGEIIDRLDDPNNVCGEYYDLHDHVRSLRKQLRKVEF